jgi:hypothetical protein
VCRGRSNSNQMTEVFIAVDKELRGSYPLRREVTGELPQ